MPGYSKEARLILFAVAGLLTMGFLSIISVDIGLRVNPGFYQVQRDYAFHVYALKLLVGIAVLAGMSRLNRDGLKKILALPVIGATAVFVLILTSYGIEISRARQWLPVGHFSFAAHETGKLALLLLLAYVLGGREFADEHGLPAWQFRLATAIIAFFTVSALVLSQPITAVHFLVTGAILLFLGGVKKRCLAAFALLVAAGSFLWCLASGPGYRIPAVNTMRGPGDPVYDKVWQSIHAKLALGSGGLWGLGLGQGRQKQLFLSDATTSSIGAAIGEELGLAGLVTILVLFAVLFLVAFRIARKAEDRFSRLLVCGSASILFTECLLHLAGVSGLIPQSMNLPFVGRNGDGHLINFVLAGILWGANKNPATEGNDHAT